MTAISTVGIARQMQIEKIPIATYFGMQSNGEID